MLPLLAGGAGLVAAALGRLPTRVFLGLIGSILLVAAVLGVLAAYWVSPGTLDLVDRPTLALVVAGGATSWLAWTDRRSARAGTREPGGAHPIGGRPDVPRWPRVVASVLAGVLGITAIGALAVATPAPPGCGRWGGLSLRIQANALADRIPGLALGDRRSGCDSGDSATISWDHESATDLVASAKAAGCRDAYRKQWEDGERFMVCGAKPFQLVLTIETESGSPTASGDLALNG